jgi:anti-anti-sigma regulatory factor
MPLTYRINRATQPDGIVFALSGVLNAEHATRLEELLATETAGRVVLDLKDVTLVDRAAVRFLALVEGAGAEIVNCPEYVRSWIKAEQDGR